jgi:hypothetical protein
MAIYLPASAEEQELSLDELTPREIVTALDKLQRTSAERFTVRCGCRAVSRFYMF